MKKVWCFNCYGVCIARLLESEISEWNKNHEIISKKIVDWRE